MRFVLAMMVMALGCGDNSPPESPYCDTAYPSCRAALLVAESNCARRIACEDDYEPTFEQCVEWTMFELCRLTDCATDYRYMDKLEECVARFEATACDEPVIVCGLTH